MTRHRVPSAAIETALAQAETLSRTRKLETQVLRAADGSYRIADAAASPAANETLVAMVDAEGETLMYALRMMA
ncbi:MAG: hypothetical protein HY060_22340 [Proteobacteria bacterium]|nr:hypothetical protein [Pseudomonadota bacterium]